MRTLEEVKELLLSHREDLREKYGVERIGVFGSFARGEQRPDSDVDLLVEFGRPVGFIAYMRLEAYLKEILGAEVEIVTKNALKPYIGKRILEEVRYVG